MPAIVWTGGSGGYRLVIEADGRCECIVPPDGEPPEVERCQLAARDVEELVEALRRHGVGSMASSPSSGSPGRGFQELLLELPDLTCEIRMPSEEWTRSANAAGCVAALERFTEKFRARVRASRPSPITLGPPQLATCSPATAHALTRALAASGTQMRLAHAGLRLVDEPVALPAEEVGALAAFRTRAESGLFADVYFFDDGDRLSQAYRSLSAPSPGAHVQVTQNGAFAVRIVAQGPDADMHAADVASWIAGRE